MRIFPYRRGAEAARRNPAIGRPARSRRGSGSGGVTGCCPKFGTGVSPNLSWLRRKIASRGAWRMFDRTFEDPIRDREAR